MHTNGRLLPLPPPVSVLLLSRSLRVHEINARSLLEQTFEKELQSTWSHSLLSLCDLLADRINVLSFVSIRPLRGADLARKWSRTGGLNDDDNNGRLVRVCALHCASIPSATAHLVIGMLHSSSLLCFLAAE